MLYWGKKLFRFLQKNINKTLNYYIFMNMLRVFKSDRKNQVFFGRWRHFQ